MCVCDIDVDDSSFPCWSGRYSSLEDVVSSCEETDYEMNVKTYRTEENIFDGTQRACDGSWWQLVTSKFD